VIAAGHALPRALDCGGERLELRAMTASDEAPVLAFAQALPEHDLLFLRRDITQPKVVSAWARSIEAGDIFTVLAWREDSVVGCAAVVRDPLSWSGHVGELRIVVAEELRGHGLGALLTQEAFARALAQGCEKLIAQMTLDQKSAAAVFEGLGFVIEAVLKEQVKDRSGRRHDVLILSCDAARMDARHAAYGLDEAF
jgi:L-amino acid N-acyltransferase YncA